MTLRGKSVIVTGAGRGLGRAYARAIAAAGGAVVVGDIDEAGARDAAREITGAGGRAVAVPGSVADWSVAEELVRAGATAFGGIHGLVANAAITHHTAPWDEPESALRAIVEVNVLGTQFVARHAMRSMVDAGTGGSIVTIVSGAQFGIRGMSAYGATKGAVTAMTANWALEGAAHGIRVNALSPLGETRMSQLDTRPERPAMPDPADIAPMVVALLSDDSAPLTGAVVRFDGTRLGRYATSLAPVYERPAPWTSRDAVEALRILITPTQD